MDPFTAALLGSSALQGVTGIVGGILGSKAQSKAQEKAIQAQYDLQARAQAFQQQMLQQAQAQLESNRAAQEAARRGGTTDALAYQQNALTGANAAQLAQFGGAQNQLAPYTGMGSEAVNRLMQGADYLTKPIQFDQAALEATPGYRFALEQGLRAQQNSATARGIGVSGGALRGAADYATGLADLTYGQQFQREMDQRQAIFNRLMPQIQQGQGAAGQLATGGMAMGADIAGRGWQAGMTGGNQLWGTGQNVASDYAQMAQQIAQLYGVTGANVGNQLTTTGQGVANNLTGIGNAQAAGIMSGVQGVQSGANNLTNYMQLQALMKQMGGGGQYGQPSNIVGQYNWGV